MKTVTGSLIIVLVFELWIIWWIHFYPTSFSNTVGNVYFWFLVFCGWCRFMCTGRGSVIVETKPDGEIVREVFIGR